MHFGFSADFEPDNVLNMNEKYLLYSLLHMMALRLSNLTAMWSKYLHIKNGRKTNYVSHHSASSSLSNGILSVNKLALSLFCFTAVNRYRTCWKKHLWIFFFGSKALNNGFFNVDVILILIFFWYLEKVIFPSSYLAICCYSIY